MYAAEGDKLFEWSAVDQFFFTASALPVVSGNLGNKNPHPLKIKRPAKSPAEVVQLVDGRDVVRPETSSRAELCLKERLSLVYGGKEPSAAKVKERS